MSFDSENFNRWQRRQFQRREQWLHRENPSAKIASKYRVLPIDHAHVSELSDPYLAEVEQLNFERNIGNFGANPFLANGPQPGTALCGVGDLKLFTEQGRGDVGLGPANRHSGIIVTGPPNRGKSTVMRLLSKRAYDLGYSVTAVEPQAGLRGILAWPHLGRIVRVFDIRELPIPLYQSDGKIDPHVLATVLTDIIARGTRRMFAQRVALQDILQRMRLGEAIPISELITMGSAAAKRLSFSARQLYESWLQGLSHLRDNLPNCFKYTFSDFPRQLFAHPAINIIETHGAPADVVQTVVAILVELLRLFKLAGEIATRHLIVLDDATSLVDDSWRRRAVGGAPLLSEYPLLLRKLNVGFVLATHVPIELDQRIISGFENVIICGFHGGSSNRICDLFGMSREQAFFLRKMPLGSCVGYVPSKWSDWPYGTFEPNDLPTVTNEECRESAQRFLSSVTLRRVPIIPLVYADSPPAPERQIESLGSSRSAPSDASVTRTAETRGGAAIRLDSTDVELLKLSDNPVPPTLVISYRLAGVRREEGAKRVRRMQQMGLVRLHELPTGRRGGSLRLMEVCESARKFIRNNAQVTTVSLTWGGFQHNLAARLIERIESASGRQIHFEHDFGGVRADVA